MYVFCDAGNSGWFPNEQNFQWQAVANESIKKSVSEVETFYGVHTANTSLGLMETQRHYFLRTKIKMKVLSKL
jgi:hypothetical protein